MPAEIAELPLPAESAISSSVLELIDRTIRATVTGRLASRRLDEIVPALGWLPGGVDTSAGATNRLNALVLATGSARWSTLAEQRVDTILTRRGSGAATTAKLIGLAVRAALTHVAETESIPPLDSSGGGGRTPEVLALLAVLATLTDHRTRTIFEQSDLRLDDIDTDARPSADVVAELVGVGRERCRQLRIRSRTLLLTNAAADPTVSTLAADLATELGSAVTLDDIDAYVRDRGLGGLDDPAAMFAVWLAGPYMLVPDHPGWMSPRPAELVNSTRRILAEAGGVHDHDAVMGDLTTSGIHPRSVDAWLGAQHVRLEHGLVVSLRGRPTSIAERALDVAGAALTTAQLQSWMPEATDAVALAADLRRSRRFVETGPGRWELAEWGGEPSQHLVRFTIELTSAALDGGIGPIDPHLADLLALRRGAPKHFPTSFGPLSVTWDGELTRHGSLRPIALACGATAGTTLIFVVDPRTGTAAVEIASGAAHPRHPGPGVTS